MRHSFMNYACFFLLAPSMFGGQPFLDRSRPNAAGLSRASHGAAIKEKDGYRYIQIQFPGAVLTGAGDVNDRGMVAGYYLDEQGSNHTFTWEAGDNYRSITFKDPLTLQEARHTLIYGLTNNNMLFGNWGSATVQHAGTYNLRTEKFNQLPDIQGKPLNLGYRMNEKGIGVGAACEGDLDQFIQVNCVGWSWDGQIYTFFSAPGVVTGGLGTVPNSISDNDIEVGYWQTATGAHSYARDKHGFAEISPFGLENSVAYDINNQGQILMLAPLDPNAYWRPLLWERGQAVALPLYPDPASVQTLYTAINNRGDLSGYWVDASFAAPFSFVALRN